MQLSHYLSVTDPLIIPMIFIFLSSHENAHDNNEFSCEFQNLVVNCKSGPDKLNHAQSATLL